MVDLFGGLGFEWLWLDIEHGPFDVRSASHTLRAAEAAGIDAILRLPKIHDAAHALPYLELDPAGVIVAHTQTAANIQAAVDTVKYLPIGKRSAGTLRGARWGVESGYAAHADCETMIMALVEDREGIANLDEILAVPELDAVVIGFGDLYLEMGHPGQKNHPDSTSNF